MNDPHNCRCATVTLNHADGREVVVNDTDADRALWAERGYFDAETLAKVKAENEAAAASSDAKKEAETQVAPIPDLSVDVDDAPEKPAKKRAK